MIMSTKLLSETFDPGPKIGSWQGSNFEAFENEMHFMHKRKSIEVDTFVPNFAETRETLHWIPSPLN